MAFTHLLQDLDEETDLDLSGLLEQGIKRGSALGFAQHSEPLLNSTELILEVLGKWHSWNLSVGGLMELIIRC